MSPDETQIRQLVSTWMAASMAGDVETVLGLMTDDVVFLLPGREPMRKDEFAAAARQQAAGPAPRIDGHSDIQEIQVAGDWAFLWSKLRVTPCRPTARRRCTAPATRSPCCARTAAAGASRAMPTCWCRCATARDAHG